MVSYCFVKQVEDRFYMKFLIAVLFLILFCNILFSAEFMEVSELKPGMKGYGLTVFGGWEPEQFNAEIIDVMKNVSPRGDIILARLSGPIVEKSGVVAGMSGSPVYIDNKLIGAVAYTWAFSREPICGITPIRQMLREKDNSITPGVKNFSKDDERLKKISTPLFINGFVKEAEEYIKAQFGSEKSPLSKESFIVMGSSGRVSGKESPVYGTLKAGDSVAVNLVEGDYHIEGIGTVTYVSNKDIYIFGHPMDLAGNNKLPISRSYVYTVIPSSYFSFKVGASSETIGATLYDGQDGVYCRLGEQADMVPVSVTVRNYKESFSYNFRVVNNRYYFPTLTAGALSSSFLRHTGYLDDKRIRLNCKIDFEHKGQKYSVSNAFLYAYNPSYFNVYGMLSDMNLYLSVFFENNMGDIKINSVKSDIQIEQGIKYYIVDNFTADKNNYRPGETVQCKVLLKQYGGNYVQKRMKLSLPSEAKSGQYLIIAGNENSFYSEIFRLFPRYYTVNNIEDLVKMASFSIKMDKLVVGLIYARPGLMVRDKKMERFPENYLSIFDYNKPWDKANVLLFPEWVKGSEEMDGAIFGIMKTSINIIDESSGTSE